MGKKGIFALTTKTKPRKKTAAAEEDVPSDVQVKPRKERKGSSVFANILRSLLLLFVCFVMVSPLKSCMISDEGYIGYSSAKEIAIEDSGIRTDTVHDLKADMIVIDGTVYYNVQFKGSITEYRYIIDAVTGDIAAQKFYHLQGEA